VDTKLSETIRQNLRARLHIEKVLIEEIIHQPEGYGIASVIIAKNSKISQHTLEDLGLKDNNIIVLSIEREGSIFPQPAIETQLNEDDRLICFGKFDLIRQLAN
jgi:ribosomal protein S6--L-glutamate ligase